MIAMVTRKKPIDLEAQMLTVPEVCQLLRIHSSTLYRLIKNKQIPGYKLGRDWRFSRESIDRWRLQQPTAASASGHRRRQ